MSPNVGSGSTHEREAEPRIAGICLALRIRCGPARHPLHHFVRVVGIMTMIVTQDGVVLAFDPEVGTVSARTAYEAKLEIRRRKELKLLMASQRRRV
jgi:hypothetical protein